MVNEKCSNTNNTIKFLCSYGGKIIPRRTDGELRYAGGHNRVLAVDRSISFAELMVKIVEFSGSSATIRCQLPNGDLETLITIKSDEELAVVIKEYDRASAGLLNPLKIRAVLSAPKSLKQLSSPLSSAPSRADFSVYRSSNASSGAPPKSLKPVPPSLSSAPSSSDFSAYRSSNASSGDSYCSRSSTRTFGSPCCGRYEVQRSPCCHCCLVSKPRATCHVLPRCYHRH